ncbi:hypothetical protein BRD05_04345 [Halobacteriales archaeon QS_9_70_65]|nr:MAG: hypothetical protein BRD05_04345 [Halobacteriales archaeon QS_9_70_65]
MLGVALLFGITAIGLSLWQTTVVPDQNAEVEFNHYGEIEGDMQELRQAHLQAVTTGQQQSPVLQLGVTYNTRVIGVNPPNPQGTLRAEELGNIELENTPDRASNAVVTTQNVCGADRPRTDAIRYDPSYARLSGEDAPQLVYENTVLYKETESGDVLVQGDQAIIQGSNINLLPIQSDAVRSSQRTSLSLSSGGYRTVKRLEPAARPNVTIATNIPASTWENELLESEIDAGYVDNVSNAPDGVEISLGQTPGDVPWTIRCAITTDSDTTFTPVDLASPPFQQGGGFGRGGITEHTPATNSDTVVLPNGRWIEIDSITDVLLGASSTTDVSGNDFSGGEGVATSFRVADGRSDETLTVKMAVTKDGDGSFQDRVLKVGPSGNLQDSPTLTDRAAQRILDGQEIDILDPANYQAETFDASSGNFGAYVKNIKQMEDATVQTNSIQGRVGMTVRSSEMALELDDDDASQSYVAGDTSEIAFDVTATGETDGRENVDLKISESGNSGLVESPRSDRETIELDGGSETFTLVWEPDWDALSTGTTYDILIEGESDETIGTVQVIQSDSAFVEVELLDYNRTVEYGDDLTATARATNLGDVDKTDTIKLNVDGNCCPSSEASEKVEDLSPGESETVTLNYDTGNLGTDKIGEVEVAAKSNNFESEDTADANITGTTIIREPSVGDLQAGQERQAHNMSFTLGEDVGQSKIKIDLTDTGDAVSHDTDSNNWRVIQGSGSISLNTNNNRVTSVVYQTVSDDDQAGDRIEIEGDYTDTTDADTDSVTKYDVEYELTSTSNYPQGETNSTSFDTTLSEEIEVEIVDSGAPVEYGETLTTTVRATNRGGAVADDESRVQLSLAGETGPEATVRGLAPGESTEVTMTYDTDTERLSPTDIGDAELKAESRDDTDARMVTIEPPTLVEKPFVENVSAGEEQLNQSMGFTLGENTDQAEIKIDLTDTGDAVSYDSNTDGNWTVVKGDGSISSLNTNDDRVTSVTYKTHSTDDRAGDEIVIAANYTDTTGAESGQVYDILYEVTPNTGSYNNDETNSTSFETESPDG